MRLFYIIIFVGTIFSSCFRDIHHSLQQVKLSSLGNYEIKSMTSGCCGCIAIYYNVYNNRTLTEQFVVETECGLYEPTKHIFKTDGKGKVFSFKSFVAVNDNSYTLPLTDTDKDALRRLDSIYSTWANGTTRKIFLTNISGFKEGGKPHFPLGIKLPKGL